MITRRMRASMAVTLGMLFVMLAFGRGRLARFYDDVGTAPADPGEIIRTLFWGDHDAADAEEPAGGEAQGRLPDEAPRAAVSSEAASSDVVRPEPEAAPKEASPALPDPLAVRDSAAAEVETLGPLHDELIEVLEAIQEAQTDHWEKRWVGDDVTLARLTKRHQMRDLRLRVANSGTPGWSISSARWGAASARARLEHKIAEARKTLASLRGR